jgi:hypothetical protein
LLLAAVSTISSIGAAMTGAAAGAAAVGAEALGIHETNPKPNKPTDNINLIFMTSSLKSRAIKNSEVHCLFAHQGVLDTRCFTD